MKQICNLVYATLIEHRNQVQIAELEVLLSEPEKKEEMRERQNAEAMKALGAMGGGLLITPPRGPQPKKAEG